MLKVVVLLACVHAVAGEDEGDWIEPEDRDPATFDDGHSLRMSQHTRDPINCGAASLFHQYVTRYMYSLPFFMWVQRMRLPGHAGQVVSRPTEACSTSPGVHTCHSMREKH